MYITYSTHAYILARYPSGEGDCTLLLFTRDFGMLRAQATSLREERSKLRYVLQTGVIVRVSLVSGAKVWRVTGGEAVRSSSAIGTVRSARVMQLVRTLLVEREPVPHLYDALMTLIHTVHTQADETAHVALVLSLLGFMSEDERGIEGWRSLTQADHASVLRAVNVVLEKNHVYAASPRAVR
jgi:recombinational DNA repair protein (RecF pathway)